MHITCCKTTQQRSRAFVHQKTHTIVVTVRTGPNSTIVRWFTGTPLTTEHRRHDYSKYNYARHAYLQNDYTNTWSASIGACRPLYLRCRFQDHSHHL
jgi:hypothetical protein